MSTRARDLGLATALFLVAAPASAAIHCAPIAGAGDGLATVDAEARLDFLRLRLRHDAARARIWAWSWAGIYSGLTTTISIQLGVATNRSDRIDDTIGAAASAVGVIALALLPRAVMADQRHFDPDAGVVGETLARYRAARFDAPVLVEPTAFRWTLSVATAPRHASLGVAVSF